VVSATQAAPQTEDPKPAVQASEPLAPPPRPAQVNNEDGTDYFSALHNGGSQFSLEPNPFEQSFGAPSQETPGKALLPSVAALTSPAIPGTSSTGGYNWGSHSLRSGPLSPAMLAGPAGSGDYFDSIGRGFPTPNESSLRTGLTPGGGGSMFPAPSPNSQALFQALQNGGATPGTVDFHRTAINAAARSKNNQSGQISNSQEQNQQDKKMDKPQQDQFASHDAEAANGLFMLAKGGQAGNQYALANQQMQQQQQPMQADPNGDNQDSHRRNTASMGSLSGPDMSGQQSDSHEEASRPNTRGGRGKKTAKAQATATSRRKADEASQKPSNKRSKGNTGSANVDPSLEPHDDEDDEDDDEGEPTHDANGRKMTDEEKRKNFLERNRYVVNRGWCV
jgi:ATF/CREB family transcription factor